MKSFKNILSVEPFKGRKISGVSKTIPNQTLTIRETIQRFVKGQQVMGHPDQEYQDPDMPFIPDPRSMDLTELHELKKSAFAKADMAKKELERLEASKKRKQEKDAIRKEIEAEEAEKRAKSEAKSNLPENQ